MHAKRQTINKSWPIPRKGTKYIAVPRDKKNGVPLIVVLRDILKAAKTRKEVKSILNQGLVSINEKIRKEENFPVLPFDIIGVGDKTYELVFSDKGKLQLRETKRKEMILKIVGKKILRLKKIQLNLLYGKNIISEEKVNVGDSVVIKDNKIVKVLHLEKGREVTIFAGKYKGREGKIENIKEKITTLSCKNEKINVPAESVMVIK